MAAAGDDALGGAGPVSVEVCVLEQHLESKRASCDKLRKRLQAVRSEHELSRSACLAGVEAARLQMEQMQKELEALQDHQNRSAEEQQQQPPPVRAESEEERARRQALLLQLRSLRQEVEKWRHQAEKLEDERPKQLQELERLRAIKAAHGELLESTRQASRHAEVDADLYMHSPVAAAYSGQPGSNAKALVPLDQAATSSGYPMSPTPAHEMTIEAQAEQRIREKAEDKSSALARRLQKLTQLSSAQHLAILSLEKQLLKEVGTLEHKSHILAHESRRHLQLKGSLRKRSDKAVVDALLVHRGPRRSASVPPGSESGSMRRPESSPQLPPISA